MTLYAVPGSADALPAVDPPAAPVVDRSHEHDWRLVQVDYTDGCSVKEFACGVCAAVWFA